jgi:hypothetical protein
MSDSTLRYILDLKEQVAQADSKLRALEKTNEELRALLRAVAAGSHIATDALEEIIDLAESENVREIARSALRRAAAEALAA